MFKEDLINEILGNQIEFCGEFFAATRYNSEPVIMTNYTDTWPNGIIKLNDLDFEILEHIAYKCWPIEEPTIYT